MSTLSVPTLARSSQALIVASFVTVVALHLADATLIGSTGATLAYDGRLNFLSELARTDLGPAMTSVFVVLGLASALSALGMHRSERVREARWVAGVAIVFVLLALLPTDLRDFRGAINASTCGDPSRIEPCTWVGRAHDVLPNVLFALIGLTWWELRRSRAIAWAPAVQAGRVCGAIALVLLIAAEVYLRVALPEAPIWVGLTQKAVVAPALVWFALVNETLVRASAPSIAVRALAA
ncbi:DUF998 domain-containing protein [Sandaracinus amylolyticus]|uniref:DUF998 domain-containing protein n=1 Tax=Sandaracinus amylolyticus TaxID=927083 RepID=UPI001F38EE87|nr:DUF998 domain-containing protein [Sandaracinus amylolyticus]UJR87011.1 Hypothetical protein I5071_91120 [Sandaracinus amylolyticus]